MRRSCASCGRCARAELCAHRACVLLGIVATCRALGVPVQAYLAWAFERLGTHRESYGLALEEVTPATFKATRG